MQTPSSPAEVEMPSSISLLPVWVEEALEMIDSLVKKSGLCFPIVLFNLDSFDVLEPALLAVWFSHGLDGFGRHALGSGLRRVIYVIAHRNE